MNRFAFAVTVLGLATVLTACSSTATTPSKTTPDDAPASVRSGASTTEVKGSTEAKVVSTSTRVKLDNGYAVSYRVVEVNGACLIEATYQEGVALTPTDC